MIYSVDAERALSYIWMHWVELLLGQPNRYRLLSNYNHLVY